MKAEKENKKNKELVKKYWKDFEQIAFFAVKRCLSEENIVYKEKTRSTQDGGYDGEFILSYGEKRSRVLFEAKLRANLLASLPLNDFAKILIISIVRHADRAFIVTNLRFSDGVIEILQNYQDLLCLEIDILNGKSIKNLLLEYKGAEELKGVTNKFKAFLTSPQAEFDEQHLAKENLRKNFRKRVQWQSTESSHEHILHIVEGSIGCGKSTLIKLFFREKSDEGKAYYVIDVSKCQTYKDFFLDLLGKSFGLTFELVDLMTSDTFAEAFSHINTTKLDEDDLLILKYVYSKHDRLPYDYSIVFPQLVKFYEKLLAATQKPSPTIAFLNLIYAQEEVLQLLMCFLIEPNLFTSVLEIAKDSYKENASKSWKNFIRNIYSANHLLHPVKNWTSTQADMFLEKNLPFISKQERRELIKKFGNSPADLCSLIALIDNQGIYKTTPRQLIFSEIMAIDDCNSDRLYEKCLYFLLLKNSDMLYLYSFLYFLDKAVDIRLLDGYLPSDERLQEIKCLSQRSNLFHVTGTTITPKNQKVKKFLYGYCENSITPQVADSVSAYINKNIKSIHFSSEQKLEYKCKHAYFTNQAEYVRLLIRLGTRYLEAGACQLAKERFLRAEAGLEDVKLSLMPMLALRLGLVESMLWESGTFRDEIVHHLKDIEPEIEKIKNKKNISEMCKTYILKFYLLSYRFYHSRDDKATALSYAASGFNFINDVKLYNFDLENCGRMWRFYAIARKEKFGIQECLDTFKQGETFLKNSAAFQFGYIIHKNMQLGDQMSEALLQEQLNNYAPLQKLEKKLTIDEYLHFNVNMAAILFMQKKYDKASPLYHKLLAKSNIFNITREKIRILNDMANMDRINNAPEEARNKYFTAKQIAEEGGCMVNYLQILINYCSFEVSVKQYESAASLSDKLYPGLLQKVRDISLNKLSKQQKEYYLSACALHSCNLYALYDEFHKEEYLERIRNLWEFFDTGETLKNNDRQACEEYLKNRYLAGTVYDHGGIYLFKD